MKARRQVGGRFLARARGAFSSARLAAASRTGNSASLGRPARRGPSVAQHGPSLTGNGRVPARLQPVLKLATARVPDAKPIQAAMQLAGCRALCDGESYCPEHKRQTRQQHDERRGTSAERGYDASHRRLRVLCFIRDEWRCVDCGWEPNVVMDFRQFEMGPPQVE